MFEPGNRVRVDSWMDLKHDNDEGIVVKHTPAVKPSDGYDCDYLVKFKNGDEQWFMSFELVAAKETEDD